MNGLSMVLMAIWPRWLGSIVMETTVAYDPMGIVEHTTTVRWLRLAMMRSVERVLLDEDGIHFTLEGESRMTMMPWRTQSVVGTGHVDPTARHATYSVSWFGAELHQTTDRRDDGFTLRQRAPGFSATQELHAVS
jgi:hypothetical protein